MYHQNYNPLGNALFSTILAAVPIAVLLYFIALHPHKDKHGARHLGISAPYAAFYGVIAAFLDTLKTATLEAILASEEPLRTLDVAHMVAERLGLKLSEEEMGGLASVIRMVLDSDPLSPASVYELAKHAETIPYEIFARIGSRVRRVAVDPVEETDPIDLHDQTADGPVF